MSYLPPNAGRMNVTFGGNTAGAAATVSTGTLGLHGGNNVTLSQNGNNVTISGGGGAAFSAGTQSVSTGTVNFANSNGVTFGMSGSSQITASHNGLTSQSIQTQGLRQINITDGVPGSGTTMGALTPISSGSLSLWPGENILISQTGNSVGLHAYQMNDIVHALDFRGNTFGTSLDADHHFLRLHAGNGISFSMSEQDDGDYGYGTVTILGGGGAGGGIALANSQTTYTSGTAHLVGDGDVTVYSAANQSLRVSIPATSSLSATGAFSISTNGGTISMGVPAFSAGISTGGNTAGTSGTASNQVVFAGGNNITLSQSTAAGGHTISIVGGGGGGAALSAGTQSVSTGTVSFANSNGITFGMSGSNQITASHNGLTTQSGQALSASNGSFAFQTAGFSNANGVTFGTSAGNIMTASVNTSYAASNHSHGNPTLNLTNLSGTTASASNGLTLSLSAANQSNQIISAYAGSNTYSSSSGTLNASSMRFVGSGNVSVGVVNGSVMVSGSGGGGIAFANSETTYSSGTVNLVGDGPATVYSAANQSYRVSIPGTSSLSAVPPFGITTNGATISMGGPSFAVSASNSVFTSGTIKLTNAGGAITVGTAAQEINFSVPATSSLSATGAVSISTNGNVISIGAPAQTVQTQNRFNLVASGNTAGVMAEISSGTMTLAGGNNVTLSQNGNAVTIAAGGVVGSYFDNMLQANASNSAGQAISYSSVSTGLYNRLILQPLTPANELFPFNISAGTMLFNFSNSSSNNMTGAHSSTWYFGLYTRVNSTQLSLLNSASVSYGMSANAGNTVSYMGARWLSVHSSLFSSAPNFVGGSRYFFGLFARTSGSTYPQISIAGMHFGQSVQRSGMMGTASSGNSTFNAWHPFMGVHSNTTITALPASIGNAEIIKASVYANFIPHVVLDAGLGAVN